MSEKETKLKPEVEAIAEVLRKTAKVNDKHQVEFDPNAFEATLPSGLDKSTIKKAEQAKQYFGIAQSLVVGELGLEHMKKHKDVKEVTCTSALPVGKCVTVLKREQVTRNVQTGEEKVNYGYVSTRLVTKVPGTQIVEVRRRMGELATKLGIGK